MDVFVWMELILLLFIFVLLFDQLVSVELQVFVRVPLLVLQLRAFLVQVSLFVSSVLLHLRQKYIYI